MHLENTFDRKLCDVSEGDIILLNKEKLQRIWNNMINMKKDEYCSSVFRSDCTKANCDKQHKFPLLRLENPYKQYLCPYKEKCKYGEKYCRYSHDYENEKPIEFTEKIPAEVINSTHSSNIDQKLRSSYNGTSTTIRDENGNFLEFDCDVHDPKNHNFFCENFKFGGICLKIVMPLEFKIKNRIDIKKKYVHLEIYDKFNETLSLEKYYAPFEKKGDIVEISLKCEQIIENTIKISPKTISGKVVKNKKNYFIVQISLQPINKNDKNHNLITPKLNSCMRVNEKNQTATLYVTKKIPTLLHEKIRKSERLDPLDRKIQLSDISGFVRDINPDGYAYIEVEDISINKNEPIYIKKKLENELFYIIEEENTSFMNVYPEYFHTKECHFCCKSFNPLLKNEQDNNLITFCFEEMRVSGDSRELKNPRHTYEICDGCLKRYCEIQFETGRKEINCPFCMKDRNISIGELRRLKALNQQQLEILNQRNISYLHESDLLQLLQMNPKYKLCPGCYTPIEKNNGCNQMSCSFCGLNFNWSRALTEEKFVFSSILPSI